MQESVVKNLVDVAIDKRSELFLTDFNCSQSNQITVVIDGDEPVSVSDCIAISREVEGQLDREIEDFSLQVTSAGVASPLIMPRQYIKNIGRKLKIKTADNVYKADLVKADQNGIEIQWKQREPKPIGKGKHTVQKKLELDYNEIEEAKVMIIFN